MCGRYTFFETEKLYERFGVNERIEGIQARYNVTPGSTMPTVVKQSPKKVQLMRWGLIPHWAKDPKMGFRMINARAETINSKPAYKKPFLTQRCIVPANGFYEWQKTNGKQPYYFYQSGPSILAIAGLWDRWEDAEKREIFSYTIITTQANESVSPVHDRMPVVLKHEDEDKWLDPESQPEILLDCIHQAGKSKLTKRPVSFLVNNPRNDEASLIE